MSCCAYSRIDNFYVFLKIKEIHGEEKGQKNAKNLPAGYLLLYE